MSTAADVMSDVFPSAINLDRVRAGAVSRAKAAKAKLRRFFEQLPAHQPDIDLEAFKRFPVPV